MRLIASCWRAAAILALAFAGPVFATVAPASTQRLLAIVDAGSSGTRLHLFSVDSIQGLPRVTQLLDGRVDPAPPLSVYAEPGNRVDEAGPGALGPLLHGLGSYLASSALPRGVVEVHVLATAGMRAVPTHRSDEIYASVRRTIEQAGYQVGQVGTIPGDDEARYAWIDVNLLSDTLHGDRPTLGIIEIGGASAQVALAVQQPGVPGTRRYRINGRTHHLLTVSYLGLGQNEARRRVLGEPVAVRGQGNACYPNRVVDEPPWFDAGVDSRRVLGSDSAFTTQCFDAFDALVGRLGAEAVVLGRLGPRDLARLSDVMHTRMVGISLVQYVFSDWRVDPNQPDVGSLLRDRLLTTCGGADAWAKVRRWLEGRASVTAQNACANGAFVHALLFGEEGLKLRAGQILLAPSVSNAPLSWARGAALAISLGGLDALAAQAEAHR